MSFIYKFYFIFYGDYFNYFTQVVLVHLGVTSVIAHIKVGQMHAALESKVLVVSAQG